MSEQLNPIQNIDFLTMDECLRNYPRMVDTYRSQFPKASPVDISIMVSIAVGVCRYCWERPVGCQCWNDD